MHPDKLLNVLNLPHEERYGYFIRKAAEYEEVWLIQDHGQYVTLGDPEAHIAIPVWPEREFAELMLTAEWKDYEAVCMEVHQFLDWLDTLRAKNYHVAGFPSSEWKSVLVPAAEMKNHLLYELQQYE